MTTKSPFRTPAHEAACLAWYDRQLAALPVPHDERDVDTVAGRTHLVLAGPPDGEPLVLVHGGGASAAMLRDEIAYYASAGFRVLAPDIPGHLGRSAPRMLPYDDATLGRWLEELMTAAGFGDANLIGWSFGGFVVLKLAAHAPHRIRRAALLVPAGLVAVSLWRGRRLVFARLMAAVTGNVKWRERLLRHMHAPGTTPDPFNFELGLMIIENWVYDLRPYPLFRPEQLQGLRAPMLVMAGELDPIFESDAALAAARRVIPNVTAERIDGCGHVFDAEHIPTIRARTIEFLRGDLQPAKTAAAAAR